MLEGGVRGRVLEGRELRNCLGEEAEGSVQ